MHGRGARLVARISQLQAMTAMDVGGFDYNEPVTNMNVLTAVQAIVNHVKNTMDMNSKIDAVRSDLVNLAGRLDLSFTVVSKTVNDVNEKNERAVKDLSMMKDQIDMWKSTDIVPSIEEKEKCQDLRRVQYKDRTRTVSSQRGNKV